jgi:hypothetical protein
VIKATLIDVGVTPGPLDVLPLAVLPLPLLLLAAGADPVADPVADPPLVVELLPEADFLELPQAVAVKATAAISRTAARKLRPADVRIDIPPPEPGPEA